MRRSVSRQLQQLLWILLFLNSSILIVLFLSNERVHYHEVNQLLMLGSMDELSLHKGLLHGESAVYNKNNKASLAEQRDLPIKMSSSHDMDHEQHTETVQSHDHHHQVAGLSCEAFGGPNDTDAIEAEMVYWRDIPSDAWYRSPFYDATEERYLTFEPDEAGFNNVRMAMEVAVTLAVAMGRTLVLPPKHEMHMMPDQNSALGLDDFFHFQSVSHEHSTAGGGFKVVSFQDFLEQVAMKGNLWNRDTLETAFPPNNRTNWDGYNLNTNNEESESGQDLWGWMRQSSPTFSVSPDDCLVAFSERANDPNAMSRMRSYRDQIIHQDELLFGGNNSSVGEEEKELWAKRVDSLMGHPTPVNASILERLRETLASRYDVCVYVTEIQRFKVIHVKGDHVAGHRLLAPFYSFLLFENWHHDLWIKRFVRDHLRFKDEIQCAAARVVAELRKEARRHGSPTGIFHTLHIRRGDFASQFQETQMTCMNIYENNTRHFIPENSTVYVATDERNKTYFRPLRDHYNVKFLRDYRQLLADVNPNYFGMIEQLIAARGETFGGVYYSTFTAYINRLRGYHSQKHKYEGYEKGMIKSYYFVSEDLAGVQNVMQNYSVVSPEYWKQEFPVAWRDIDHDVQGETVS